MSNIDCTSVWAVKLMRWAARLLSVAWAFWALFWTWFATGSLHVEGDLSFAVSIIIMITALLMFLGAAIIASAWRKEAFGGVVLLLDGVLLIPCFLLGLPHIRVTIWEFFTLSHMPFNIVFVLPPLVAGSLFLICHRRSKKSGEQHV